MKHKWRRVGESLYECENCGAEAEGYAECWIACVPPATTPGDKP